ESIVNTATTSGTDPRGTVVTAQATDDVDVFTSGIGLTKLVDGQPTTTVPVGTTVTYTYAVTNTGDTPLGTVTLADDTPFCQTPTRGADNPGNNDAILELTEVWTYSCTATATAVVTNTAIASGVSLNPAAANAPFPNPNSLVTALDRASVEV